MQFRIADTFTDSLAKLTGGEQKAAKITAFDLQRNPASPGLRFHKLSGARDPNFWSVRAGRDLRLIVHRTPDGLLLCYVGHHDKAYRWGERRRLETHPRTGAAQFVEIRETVRETVHETAAAQPVEGAPPAPSAPPTQPTPPQRTLFADMEDESLLAYGVPEEWLGEVRAANEDSLLEVAEHLPAEAAEALLELATGGRPELPRAPVAGADPFAHADAGRRFGVIENADELARALEYPWEKWTVFLHPAQRRIVEWDYDGPARISGSAGTGKTIVALHRAAFLARRHPEARVLLTTFSAPLAAALQTKLRRLICNEPRLGERIEVGAVDEVGERLYKARFKARFGAPRIASREHVRRLLAQAGRDLEGLASRRRFLLEEWEDMVDAPQIETWEAYRDVRRAGRRIRLSERQRAELWPVFAKVHAGLREQGLITRAGMFHRLARDMGGTGDVGDVGERRDPPFDFIIVDEAQDVSAAQLRFLAAMGGRRANGLFFTGDLGQRIFRMPFSWKAMGVDVRGRSRTLRVNYRTSHQIRMRADCLLGAEVADADGNVEDRRGTVSTFGGEPPFVGVFDTRGGETDAVTAWLEKCERDGMKPHEIGVFVRSGGQMTRAEEAVRQAGLSFKALRDDVEIVAGHALIGTMHLAKGLEFRAVAVMACDEEVIPLQQRIEAVADEAGLEEAYNTERHLLYVACTRARDRLLVTGVAPASEFLDDLRNTGGTTS